MYLILPVKYFYGPSAGNFQDDTIGSGAVLHIARHTSFAQPYLDQSVYGLVTGVVRHINNILRFI